MPLDLLRSPTAVDTILLLMLLAWLGGSAAMTLLTGMALSREEEAEPRRADRTTAATFPPAPGR
jgi:hypothetical protein